MALVNQVQKKVMMSKKNIIKFQILTHCYINCLTLLSSLGPIELTHFCYDAADEHRIFKSQQTVRNCINKCEKTGLVKKDLKNKKIISINDNIKIQTEGTILLDYKFLGK